LVASGRSIYDALLSAVPGTVPLPPPLDVALLESKPLPSPPEPSKGPPQENGDAPASRTTGAA
jgi:hypothetical protein